MRTGTRERRLFDRTAQHHVEPLVKFTLAAELLAGNELAQGDAQQKTAKVRHRGSGEDRYLRELAREAVEHPGRLRHGAPELQRQHVVRDGVLHLHLVEENHVRPAEIGGACRHALTTLRARDDEVDDPLAHDEGLVHGRVELGDGDEVLLRQRAREQAVVATDAGHDLVLGLLAEELLGVGQEAPPAEGKPHVVQKRASAARGLPQLAQPRERAGAGAGGAGVGGAGVCEYQLSRGLGAIGRLE